MPDEVKLSLESVKMLAAEIVKQSRSSATSSALPAASTSLFKEQLDNATKSMNPFTRGVSLLKDGADLAKGAFDQIHSVIQPNLDTFRDLSKTGASFSNDLVSMVVAQKGMQLSTEEFTEIMKSNAANFTGLGGSVTRGAEAFARLSKEFLESEFTDGLKQAGYTTKELNDVLAFQATMARSTFREDETSRKASIDAASRLATEMDLQAKLTGKSREEQLANMRQIKEDAAIEAKFRLIGIEKGLDAEKAAREEYGRLFNAAQLQGQEKVFRETALYGTTVSKEAAMQGQAAGQSANKAMIDAGRAFREGEFDRAKQLQEQAQADIITHQRSAAFLQTTMIPAQNALVDSQRNAVRVNQGVYDALQKVRQMEEHKFKSDTEKLQIATELAAKAAAGQNEQGQEVSGATKAIINFGTRIGETEAALYKGIVDPINRMVGPALGQLADKTLGRDTVRRDGSSSTYAKDLENVIAQGRVEKQKVGADSKLGFDPRRRPDESQTNIPGAAIFSNASATIFKGADLFTQAVDRFNASQAEPKKRQTGSIGMTGNLFEDFGAGTMVQLHGKESVLTEKQLMDMAKGINTSALGQSLDSFKKVTVSGSQNIDRVSKTAASPDIVPKQPMNNISNDLTNIMQSMLSQNKQILDNVNTKDIADVMQTSMNQSKQILSSINTKDIADVMQTSMNQNKQVIDNANTKDITSVLQSTIKENIGAFDAVDMKNISNNVPSIMSLDSANIQTVTPKNMLNSLQNIDIEKQFRSMSEKLAADDISKTTKNLVSDTKQTIQTKDNTDFTKQRDVKSTLDDVVGGLNTLNTKIERLLDTQLDLGTKQIRATKSNNSNLYARA